MRPEYLLSGCVFIILLIPAILSINEPLQFRIIGFLLSLIVWMLTALIAYLCYLEEKLVKGGKK